MFQLESIKNVNISPCQNIVLYGSYRVVDKRAHKIHKSELHGNYQPYIKCLHRESGHIQLYATEQCYTKV